MNKYLMEFYDEYYQNKTITKLEHFASITFPSDGTDKLFVGITLVLITSVYKTRATAEALLTILNAFKESIGSKTLMEFYLDRVNGNKLISNYLFKEIKSEDLDKHVDVILDWLNNFYYDFSKSIKEQYKDKIEEYKVNEH